MPTKPTVRAATGPDDTGEPLTAMQGGQHIYTVLGAAAALARLKDRLEAAGTLGRVVPTATLNRDGTLRLGVTKRPRKRP